MLLTCINCRAKVKYYSQKCKYCGKFGTLIEIPENIITKATATMGRVVRAIDLRHIKLNLALIPGFEFLNPVSKHFLLALWGEAGGGKSNLMLSFANAISSRKTPTLYISSEQGYQEETMLLNIQQRITNPYVFVGYSLRISEIMRFYNEYKSYNLIVDSINETNISPKIIKHLIRPKVKGIFGFILQITKKNTYKGSAKIVHECDIQCFLGEGGKGQVKKTRFGKRNSFQVEWKES